MADAKLWPCYVGEPSQNRRLGCIRSDIGVMRCEVVLLSKVVLEELRDLYSAGNQLVKVLPKLTKAAEDDELQQPF